MNRRLRLTGMAALLAGISLLPGAEPAKLLRQPGISATLIAFAYGGEIWVVPRSGGEALRLRETSCHGCSAR